MDRWFLWDAARAEWTSSASGLVLGGRPRGLLRAMIAPWWKISPPQTPHGSARSSAPARQAVRSGQGRQCALACSSSAGSSENHRSLGTRWQGSGSASAGRWRLLIWIWCTEDPFCVVVASAGAAPVRSVRRWAATAVVLVSARGPALRRALSSCGHGDVKTSASWPICGAPSRAGLRGTIPGRRRPASLSPARERPGRRAGRGRRYPAWRTRASGGSGRFAGR